MQGIELAAYIWDQREGVTSRDLQQLLSASERTVRNRIAETNDRLAGCARIVYDRAQHGYAVQVEDPERFDALIAPSASGTPDPFDRLPSTPEERVDYLLQDLLQRTDWIRLEDLCSVLFISRSTCSASLKVARERLAEFGLAIESRPRYGLRVTGPEMGRRLCLASLAVKNLVSEGAGTDPADPAAQANPADPARLSEISACVQRVLDAEDFKVNPMAHQNLIVHIAVALLRIEQGAYVPMDPGNVDEISATREFAVAAAIAAELSRAFHVELPREEVAYIAIHLAGKRAGQDADLDDSLVVDDEAWGIAADMIEAVWRAFRFDFRDDVELRMNLARHIMPLSVRLRYHMQIANPMLDDIKARLPLAFSMAVDACAVLSERFGAETTEDEIGYVALSFALACERRRGDAPKKRVLVVCASGAGSARLLAARVQREFGSYIGQVRTCDISEFEHVDLSSIDYVFTTVPLARPCPVPVLQVTMFLDGADRAEAESALAGGAPADLARFFRPELFCPSLAAKTPEEAIAALVRLAARTEDLPRGFERLVLERERMSATSFGNLVAMPHPREAVSERTFAAVGVLEREIDWGGRPVAVVLLVSVARDAGDDLNEFYRAASRLLANRESIGKLIEKRDFETLLNELKG